ncbi:hypothetical protein C6P40_004941 [Pichia californica]|uniref:J domain-containing protein n=1 Tax=Pichia californica TaxID=460514 RepID=A0A9P6WNR3_9ASCO|nr:hypothetical protein C6P42_000579 [[Candida] californica]KAG0689482.1 hypothetical protein C6P40_004941 [[Candida] californica]
MDRHVKNDYLWLQGRSKTAYQILGIDVKSDLNTIKKAYRQKALIYHPDKNNSDNSAEIFREIVTSYNILSDINLKTEYDNYISTKNNIINSSNNVKSKISNNLKNEKIAKFKADLKKKEKDHKLKTEILENKKLDDLRNYIPSFEKLYNQPKSSIINDYKINDKNKMPTLTVVSWKNKKDFQLDEDLIKKLMEIFGPVSSVKMFDNEPNDNYHSANVDFKSSIGAALASTHAYYESSKQWDHINMHKISTLLRNVEIKDAYKIDWDNVDTTKLNSIDFISYSILME